MSRTVTTSSRRSARLLFALLLGALLALAGACGDSDAEPGTGGPGGSSTDPGASTTDPGASTTDPGASTGTGTSATPDPELVGLLKSTKERGAADAPDADLRAVVVGEADYALDLLRGIAAEGEENIIFSSLSVRSAFAMLWAGARGDTADELAAALRFSLPDDQFHAAWNRLDQALASREDVTLEEDGDEAPRLRIVNDLWGLDGYPYVEAWLDTMAEFYGAGLWIVDFINAPEAARLAINDYIADATNDRILDILPEDSIDEGTRLVLTNAIWFKAGWDQPFYETQTEDEEFTTASGATVSVPMMKRSDDLIAHEVDGHRLVELPYIGRELSMVLLLPAEGELESLRDTLDGETLLGWFDAMTIGGLVNLWMPRFEFKTEVDLVPMLQDLGVEATFEECVADLSGLSETALAECLHVTGAFHQGFIAVDEEGTEAAAATAVVVGAESAPMPRFDVILDRPFLYFIRDRVTGALLFAGQVGDPS